MPMGTKVAVAVGNSEREAKNYCEIESEKQSSNTPADPRGTASILSRALFL